MFTEVSIKNGQVFAMWGFGPEVFDILDVFLGIDIHDFLVGGFSIVVVDEINPGIFE